MASFNGKATTRRTALQCMLGVASVCATGIAHAQKYPDRVLTFIVAANPGGAADITARGIAEKMTESMGQQVIIFNEARAGGALALRRLIDAPPDGYTMLMMGPKSAIANAFGKAGSEHLLQDVIPVTNLSSSELAVIVPPTSPLKDMADLVRKIKGQPGKVTIGVGDVTGGIQHMGAELFRNEIQGRFVVVPYGSSAKLTMAVRTGEVDAAFELMGPVMGFIRENVIKALAITGPHRYPELASVPTVAEAGFPKSELVTNSFLVVPARTPADVVRQLNAGVNRVLSQPDLQAKGRARGSRVPDPVTPAEASKLFAMELAKWIDIVQMAGVKLE